MSIQMLISPLSFPFITDVRNWSWRCFLPVMLSNDTLVHSCEQVALGHGVRCGGFPSLAPLRNHSRTATMVGMLTAQTFIFVPWC